MTFDVPEIEDPSIVTSGASEIRTAGENVQQKMRDTSNAWQPISGQYHAPEDGQVHRAMRTPEEMADEIMKSAGKVADGLDTYADKLGPLRTRKTDLEDEIKEYEAAKATADPTDAAAQASLAAWELRLQNKCTQLRIDRDAADSACANSIRNTTESTGAVIGKKLLGAITRGNNVEGAMGGRCSSSASSALTSSSTTARTFSIRTGASRSGRGGHPSFCKISPRRASSARGSLRA